MTETIDGTFDAYAAYYDLLYCDKDYLSEVNYIHRIIQDSVPNAKTILEFGCGTGRHAAELSKLGYKVTGVDRSQAMISRSKERFSALKISDSAEFTMGDIRNVRLNETFDVVLALFHVISYQVTNQDLLAAIKSAAVHLKPGGLFIFDCWYGPGVLSDPPKVRVLRLQDGTLKITRIAEPVPFPNENTVDVNFEIIVESDLGTQHIKETHKMRYLFVPEIDILLNLAKLRLAESRHWMQQTPPRMSTWNACFVCKK